MSNFVNAYLQGQKGKNKGLSTGLQSFTKAIDGVQRRAIYAIAASPKVGKTTLADLCFVIEPYLDYIKRRELNPDLKMRLKFIYYSFEINRIKKEFKYAAHFMFRDYGISHFKHKDKFYPMSPRYLEGKLIDDDEQVIKVLPEHEICLKEIYEKRIVPLFGRYDADGKQVQKGIIEFIEERDNPTGLRNYIMHYASEHGKFIHETYKIKNEQNQLIEKQRIIGYKSINPEEYIVIITDHVRKLKRERGYLLKENIDKWIEYQVELRNWCGYTFVDVVHLNRGISSIERIKYLSEFLYPTGDDVKDTGNLSEDCDYLITLFNPKDEKYNIKKHFGTDITEIEGYRSLHLVESRDTECPMHLQLIMMGGINLFKTF
jgi:hypothetical protein